MRFYNYRLFLLSLTPMLIIRGFFSWEGVDRPPMTNTGGERVVARRRLRRMVKGLRPRQVEPRPSDETGAGEARPDGLQAAERSELAFRARRETRARLDRWWLFELYYICSLGSHRTTLGRETRKFMADRTICVGSGSVSLSNPDPILLSERVEWSMEHPFTRSATRHVMKVVVGPCGTAVSL